MEAERKEKSKRKETKYSKGKTYGDEEVVEGTDADRCMSSCSFWSVGSLLPASSRSAAGAALSVRASVRQHEQHMVVQTRRGARRHCVQCSLQFWVVSQSLNSTEEFMTLKKKIFPPEYILKISLTRLVLF